MTQTLEPTPTAVQSGPAQTWLADFEAALKERDIPRAAGLFATKSFWRDLVAFSWNITTVEDPTGVADLLSATLERVDPSGFALEEPEATADGVTTAWFTFETAIGRGRGLLRLKVEDDRAKAWTFLTTLYELKGHEEPRGVRRPKGAEHGVNRDRVTWAEKRQAEAETLGLTEQPYAVVIGGGQGGIALGARLRQLGVPSLVIDRFERPGDQWRGRYKSLCLHDPVWYDHLPYLKFPDNWPVFAPKDKMGDWLESYTQVMELDYWSNSEATSATFDEATGAWTVHVTREGREVVLHPAQLVLATGMSGIANVPTLPGQDVFQGDQHHSSKHPGGARYVGKKVVVIGSNNSAHDICADLWQNGAQPIMLQRSSTHIVRSDSLMDTVLGPLYSEEAVANGIDHDTADLVFAS
ncbi:MAG TPA: NAD(P)/FAD-dependent oxidoreductase, partial [Nocardioides sp.]